MKTFIPLILALCLALLSGCDEVKAPRAIPGDKLPAGAIPRNVVVDPNLDSAIVAGQTSVKEGSKDQPMSVSQAVRNTRDYSLEIQYQYTFFDADNRPLQSSGGWRNITLDSRVERFLEGAALDTTAVDWRLTVRAAK